MAEISNSALCELYEIGIYRVGEVFERYRRGEPVRAEDRDKWFVAAPTGMFSSGEVAAIPLADSFEEAERLAVKCLRLRELHRAVCDLGLPALRMSSFAEPLAPESRCSRISKRSLGEMCFRFL